MRLNNYKESTLTALKAHSDLSAYIGPVLDNFKRQNVFFKNATYLRLNTIAELIVYCNYGNKNKIYELEKRLNLFVYYIDCYNREKRGITNNNAIRINILLEPIFTYVEKLLTSNKK